MMLAAVETMTKADPVRTSRGHDSDVAAQATARELIHPASPLETARCLVQKLPGIGTVQSSNAGRLDHSRIEVAKVDAHPAASADGLPVRHATARSAPTECEALVPPNVAVERTSASNDLHLALIVVAPEASVATTD